MKVVHREGVKSWGDCKFVRSVELDGSPEDIVSYVLTEFRDYQVEFLEFEKPTDRDAYLFVAVRNVEERITKLLER